MEAVSRAAARDCAFAIGQIFAVLAPRAVLATDLPVPELPRSEGDGKNLAPLPHLAPFLHLNCLQSVASLPPSSFGSRCGGQTTKSLPRKASLFWIPRAWTYSNSWLKHPLPSILLQVPAQSRRRWHRGIEINPISPGGPRRVASSYSTKFAVLNLTKSYGSTTLAAVPSGPVAGAERALSVILDGGGGLRMRCQPTATVS